MVVLFQQEWIAVWILVLVTGVCLAGTILLDGIGKEPFTKEYMPGMADGTLVRYSGVAGQVTHVTGGSAMLEVSGVKIFIPASAGIIPDIREGSGVSLIGVVQHWKGAEEILIEDSTDIRIIS
ncbi:hypothetical protein ACKUB1_04700 [Methanospirillum stamsii]|uniref:Uncharacterized protein n=1 Tax=Methanospirillum stamsii TaxID=1277351 RepID=A0A2V2MZG8_9EURY|nr:hypothetical protein [Methanospirillum stamsii]PWR73534.1 hypothetical protein DLD82_09870 [Methanospirillum stamsii]